MKIGDTVSVLDENLTGVVIAIDKGKVTLRTEDGFEMVYSKKELVVLDDTLAKDAWMSSSFQSVLSEKQSDSRPKSSRTGRSKKKKPQPMEVDLHIHHLVDSVKNLSNYEMLNIQMDEAKRQLEFAISKRMQSIVFIHGVGEGVLREELYTLFRRYDAIDFFDADYQKYGVGATEVYIYQNPKR